MKKYSSRFIGSLTEEERNDRVQLLALINEDAGAFRLAADHLQDDAKVAFEAVKRDPFLMRYVSERLRGDKDFAYKCFNFHLTNEKYGDRRIHFLRGDLSKELQSLLESNGNDISIWKTEADEERRFAKRIKRLMVTLPATNTPRPRL